MTESLWIQWLDSGSESENGVQVETAAEVTVVSVDVKDVDVTDVNTDLSTNKVEQENTRAICEKQFSSRSNLNKHIKR